MGLNFDNKKIQSEPNCHMFNELVAVKLLK
jgi:hypothetical protein